jgi:apolipoprotein N-acyltransferase
MIVGTTYYDHQVSGLSKYNAAILFQPGRREVQAYYKLHLVPFGEYVPLVKTFPPIRILTPYRDDHIPSLDSGKRPRWLDWDGLRLAVAICFEDTLPHVVRSVIGQVPDGRTPDVLVNQTNDGWFYGSSEHEAHLAISVFRSIEHRVPLLRAANTGISAVVDGNGRVLAQIQPTKEGVLTHSVPLDDRTALYTRVGDWLPILASVLSLVVFPLSFVLSRRTSSPNHPGLPNAE